MKQVWEVVEVLEEGEVVPSLLGPPESPQPPQPPQRVFMPTTVTTAGRSADRESTAWTGCGVRERGGAQGRGRSISVGSGGSPVPVSAGAVRIGCWTRVAGSGRHGEGSRGVPDHRSEARLDERRWGSERAYWGADQGGVNWAKIRVFCGTTLRIRNVMLSKSTWKCGEAPQLITPRTTSLASPPSHTSS